MNKFQVAAGSIVGRAHVGTGGLLKGKNNQDSFLYHQEDSFILALVLDGCGSARHSEVGSRIGGKLLESSLLKRIQRSGLPGNDHMMRALLASVELEVIAELHTISLLLAGNGSFSDVVNEYMSFTILGAFVTDEYYAIFGLGDGFFWVNGSIRQIGPFPKNTPPLLVYRLFDAAQYRDFSLTIHDSGETEGVNSILIASDGIGELNDKASRMLPGQNEPVGPVSQFWTNDEFFRNPDAIRRRLVLMNSERFRQMEDSRTILEPGILSDDTTLVVIRRREETTQTYENQSAC